uniref:Uncharacterized protein n=1 Tax=Ditylenchus dipsaci TaxID=166011 RepID=A0A915DP67_9BILA
MANNEQGGKKNELTSVPSTVTVMSNEDLALAPTQPSSPAVSEISNERVTETVDRESKSLEIYEIILEFWGQLAQIPLYVYSFFVRIWKILQILSEMCVTAYKMLCFAYNYPNASRHATWITYRALMISYKFRLWSLSGLCERVNKKVEKRSMKK